MNASRSLIAHLLRNDLRLIARDKLLATMTFVVLVMGIAMRYALPALDTALANGKVMPSEGASLRFADTFPAFVAFVVLWQGANMPGIIFGFILLGEKEDHTLEAMAVTPLTLGRYAGYRVLVSFVMAFFFIVYLGLTIGHASVPFLQLIPLAFAASFSAPLSALTYANFAQNKIQGLAFTKFGGLAGLIILAGYFVPAPWQWLASLFPPFLAAKAYWMTLEGQSTAIWPLFASILLQSFLIRFLLRRFTTSVA